jgi:hypothetical protein
MVNRIKSLLVAIATGINWIKFLYKSIKRFLVSTICLFLPRQWDSGTSSYRLIIPNTIVSYFVLCNICCNVNSYSVIYYDYLWITDWPFGVFAFTPLTMSASKEKWLWFNFSIRLGQSNQYRGFIHPYQ